MAVIENSFLTIHHGNKFSIKNLTNPMVFLGKGTFANYVMRLEGGGSLETVTEPYIVQRICRALRYEGGGGGNVPKVTKKMAQ
jgi:hypothetical protein